MRPVAPGQLAHLFHSFVAARGDDVGRSKGAAQRQAVGLAAHEDDLLRAQAFGGNDGAQADRAVADHGGDLARADARGDGGVVTGGHHVGERQQRGHQGVVASHRQGKERAVGIGHAHRFALAAVLGCAAPPRAVDAGGVQTLAAENARAVGNGERRGDEIARLQRAYLRAHGLNNADEFVAHAVARLAELPVAAIRPQVAAADGRAGDDH